MLGEVSVPQLVLYCIVVFVRCQSGISRDDTLSGSCDCLNVLDRSKNTQVLGHLISATQNSVVSMSPPAPLGILCRAILYEELPRRGKYSNMGAQWNMGSWNMGPKRPGL